MFSKVSVFIDITMNFYYTDVGIDPHNQSVVIGSYATITCIVAVSSSVPTFWWLHNGTRKENETSAILNLTNVQESDSGTYQCIVVLNNVMMNSSSASLQTFYKPITPSK